MANNNENFDERVMNILEGLIESENQFLTDRTIRLIQFNDRPRIVERYLNNHNSIVSMVSRLVSSQLTNAAATILTYALPTVGSTFMEPVIVSPTQTQINNAIQDEPNPRGDCAICQEPISSSGVKMRYCGHVFHRSCISQWFRSSVRCPVCRHDIREDSANQTSAV